MHQIGHSFLFFLKFRENVALFAELRATTDNSRVGSAEAVLVKRDY
jgi:hypothetical protein